TATPSRRSRPPIGRWPPAPTRTASRPVWRLPGRLPTARCSTRATGGGGSRPPWGGRPVAGPAGGGRPGGAPPRAPPAPHPAPAAARDLAQARGMLAGVAPRGLTALLDGVDAGLEAVGGEFDRAARRLAGLAVSTVPADPLAVQCWGDLVMTVVVAAGDDRRA